MTFSVLALTNGLVGVASATCTPAVGASVQALAPRVGGVVTQGWTNRRLRGRGLALLREGAQAQLALDQLLADDPQPQLRQVAIIDASGRVAAHSGDGLTGWAGHIVGDGVVFTGNLLTGARVVEAMAERFDQGAATLSELLVETMLAGDEAGGDRRGRMSASLRVLELDEDDVDEPEHLVNLRVDLHPDAVVELAALHRVWTRELADEVAAGRYRKIDSL